MALFNGDRVCIKDGDTLKFGRFQEYIEDQQKPPPPDFNDFTFRDPLSYSSLSSSHGKPSSSSPPSNLNDEAGKPGDDETRGLIVSPMLATKRRRLTPELLLGEECEGKPVKRQIVWDDNNGAVELRGSRMDDESYKVIDRKFTVGQNVCRGGLRGKVTEIVPIVTVKVHKADVITGSRNSSRNAPAELITDLCLSDLEPISPLFNGVNIEYNGWIGQIIETERRVKYKLSASIRGRETYQFTFYDSVLLSSTIRRIQQRSRKTSGLPQSFTYPFFPQAFSNPFKGRLEILNKTRLETEFAEEDEKDKENINTADCNDNENVIQQKNTPVKTPKTLMETNSSPGITSPNSTPKSSKGSRSRPSLSLSERKKSRGRKYTSIQATVESVSVVGIKVRWTGKLPADLIKPSPVEKIAFSEHKANKDPEAIPHKLPPTYIGEKELKSVHSFFIHPTMFFDKKGLCTVNLSKSKGMIISEKRWADELYKSLVTSKDLEQDPFDLNSVALLPPALPRAALESLRKSEEKDTTVDDYFEKRKQESNGDEQRKKPEGNDVIVCKHFVRHMYKVMWELEDKNRKSCLLTGEDKVGLYYGNQLEPDLNQVHKLCLGLIHSHLYVVAKEGSWMEGKWDYGVVIEKPSDDSVIVEWLRVREDGNVVTERVLQCSLVEIDKHPTFNELHEGRIVTRRKEAAQYELCKNFRFGTVVSVQRFSLGKLSVYCPVQRKIISLWPHMVEVSAELSMKYLIANNIVGLNKPKEDEINVQKVKQQTIISSIST